MSDEAVGQRVSASLPSNVSNVRGWRRVLAVSVGCTLVACLCVVGSGKSGREAVGLGGSGEGSLALSAEDAWPYGRDPNVIRDGPDRVRFDDGATAPPTDEEKASIIQQIDKAGEDMRRMNTFLDDQEKFNTKIMGSMNALKGKFDATMAEARTERAKLETGLTQMNDETFARVRKNIHEELDEHANITATLIADSHVAAFTRINAASKTFGDALDALAAQMIAAGKSDVAQRKVYDQRKELLSTALAEYEAETDGEITSLENKIQGVLSQLQTANSDGDKDINDFNTEITGRLSSSIQVEHDAAMRHMQQIRHDIIETFEQKTKELEASIVSLGERNKAEIMHINATLFDAQDRHVVVSKRLSDNANDANYIAADASKQVGDMKSSLAAQILKLKDDLTRARAALKGDHEKELARIQTKVQSSVAVLHKRLDEKETTFRGMYTQVHEWLQKALSLEDESKGWHHERQERNVAQLTRDYANTEERAAALERVVSKIDAEYGAKENEDEPVRSAK